MYFEKLADRARLMIGLSTSAEMSGHAPLRATEDENGAAVDRFGNLGAGWPGPVIGLDSGVNKPADEYDPDAVWHN